MGGVNKVRVDYGKLRTEKDLVRLWRRKIVIPRVAI